VFYEKHDEVEPCVVEIMSRMADWLKDPSSWILYKILIESILRFYGKPNTKYKKGLSVLILYVILAGVYGRYYQ
jgi:hypothetical protein